VIQYNKMDLADQGIPILDVELLERDINRNSSGPLSRPVP